MKRALAIATLLRSKISAKTEAARGPSTQSAPATAADKKAARRRFDRKPPEPAPSIPHRIFCGAPRLRDRV